MLQGEVRICKKDFDDPKAKMYGPLDRCDTYNQLKHESKHF
jgi:hypothetical protein